MATLHVSSVSGATMPENDASWRGLYRVGALSAAIYVLLIIIPIILINVAPVPPLAGGTALLDYIAANRAIYIAELVSFVGLSLPAMVVFLALYAALHHVNRSYAALGAVIGIASETMALAYNSSPPSLHTGLIYLSDRYVATADIAQRASLATAAESLMAVSNAVNTAGILTALAILIVSLVLRQSLFTRGAGWLGIATGVAGIGCELFRDVIGPGYYVYGLLLPAWFVAVGWKLYRLSATAASA